MTGWALFIEGQLDSFGQIDGHSETSSLPPYDLVDKTAHAARRTYERVVSSRPDAIVLEETNIGGRSGQRSQKFLEWEHLALLQLLEQVPGRASVSYLQSRQWRAAIGLGLSKADRAQNKILSQVKRKIKDKLGRNPTPAELSAAKAEAGISGKVWVQFVVRKDGVVDSVRTVRGVHPLLDAEAERVVRSMPVWKPGTMMGRPIAVRFNVPLVFSIVDTPAERKSARKARRVQRRE
jgi:TonB family protein